MRKIRVAALAVLGVLCLFGTANAWDNINGKKGITAYVQHLGGARGLAFNYGTGNLQIEGSLAADLLMPDSGDGINNIDVAAGVHFHALRAEKGSFSLGGRANVGLGKDATGVEDVTQFGLDIPMRVNWFANEHISLFAEGGIAIIIGPEKGSRGGFPAGAGPKGKEIAILGGGGGFGGTGMTFWW